MDSLIKELDAHMRRFQGGDLSSFPSFYELTHRKIFYICLGLVGQKEDAEDICQQTYVQCIEKLSSYSPGSNPLSFLATIARNYCYSLLRKREESLSYEDEAHSSSGTYDTYTDYQGIDKMLEVLKPEEKEIVILHVIDEMKFADIAKTVGKKLSSVLVSYHRAMKKLRKEESNRL